MINNDHSSERSEAYIALGANVGERERTLHEAIRLLDAHPNVSVLRCSGIYETDPVGYEDQPPFLNMTIAVQTNLDPEALLAVLMDIERQLGRVRDIRWGPRTIDLDLLLMNGLDRTWNSASLTLPHPRMAERLFVLVPLSDIALDHAPAKGGPADEGPEAGVSLPEFVKDAMGKLEGKEGVRFWTTCNWQDASGRSAN